MVVARAVVFLAVFACLGYAKEVSETDAKPEKPPVLDVLEQFLKLAEEHKLNISVIVSRHNKHMNMRLKNLNDVAFLTPPIKMQLKESTLTKEVQKKWMDEIDQNRDMEVRRAQARNVDVNTNEVEELRPNYPVHKSASYQWITNFDKTLGRQVFPIENPNVHVWYNFEVESPEKHHVEMIASNMTVEVVARGAKLTSAAEDLLESSMAIRTLWHMFDDDTEFAKGLGRVLDKVVPDRNWQVVVGSEHFNIPTEDWILLKVIEQNVLVYSGNV